MVVTLTGDNDYLIRSEISRIVQELGLDSLGLGISRIYGQQSTVEDVRVALTSYSLFDDKRLVILDQPNKVKGFEDALEQILEDLPETTHLIILEPSLDKRRTYYKLLTGKTDLKQFNRLDIPSLIKWVEETIKERGGSADNSAARYLAERVGDNQSLLEQEIDKLLIYSGSITRESVELLTEQSPSSTIFELLDAAFGLNVAKALRLYNEQRLLKVEPAEILAMLSWQMQVLAIYMSSKNMSQSLVLSISGLSPYTLTKARQISPKLSFSQLKNLVKELSQIDLASKSVSFDLDEGLKNFITSLSYA